MFLLSKFRSTIINRPLIAIPKLKRNIFYFRVPWPDTKNEIEDQMSFEFGKKCPDEMFDKIDGIARGRTMKVVGRNEHDSMITVYDPLEMEKFLAKNDDCPHRPGYESWLEWRESRNDWFKGFKGLYLEQGETWQKYRTIMDKIMFDKERLNAFVPAFDEVTKDFLQITANSINSLNCETPHDYGTSILRYSFEVIGISLFGERMFVLEKNVDNRCEELFKLMNKMLELTHELDLRPSAWSLTGGAVIQDEFERLEEVLDEMTELLENIAYDRAGNTFGEQQNNDLQPIIPGLVKSNPEAAILIALDMISLGPVKLSATLKNLLYYLGTNTDIQQILRQEILSILPDKNSTLTLESLQQMPYFHACLSESMRLRPIDVGIKRRLNFDTAISNYRIPKGTKVLAFTRELTKDKKLVFPNPHLFLPERWIKGSDCEISEDFAKRWFMPFGYGSRACVGRCYSELQMAILITKMVRKFDIKWNYPEPKSTVSIVKEFTGHLNFELNARE